MITRFALPNVLQQQRFFFLLFCVLISATAFGQQPKFEHYSVQEGLPSTIVYHARQDAYQQIWLATGIGVTRYDGNSFRNYSVKDSLNALSLTHMYESPTGVMYCFTNSSKIYRFNRLTDRWSKVYVKPELESEFQRHEAASMVELENGELLVGFRKTRSYATVKTNGDIEYHRDTTRHGVGLRSFGDHLLFYGQPNYGDTIYYNDTKSTFSGARSVHLNAEIIDETYTAVATGRSLVLLKNERVIDELKFDEDVVGLDVDDNGYLWPTFMGLGVAQVSYKNDQLKAERFFHEEYICTSVLRDHEGGYWFCTGQDGVFYSANINAAYYNLERGLPNRMPSNIGGNGKNEVLIGFQNRHITVMRDDTIYETINLYEYPGTAAELAITEIVYDSIENTYWIAAGGVYSYKDGVLKNESDRFPGRIRALDITNDNAVWMGGKNIYKYRNDSLLFSKKVPSFLLVMGSDGENVLATLEEGFHRLEGDSFVYLGDQHEGYEYVGTVAHTTDGKVLTGSYTKGLTLVLGSDTLDDKAIHGVGGTVHRDIKLTDNRIWTASAQAFEVIDYENEAFYPHTYSREVGIYDKGFLALHLTEDAVWICALGGIYKVYYEDLQKHTPPAPRIQSLSTSDTLIAIQDGDAAQLRWDASEVMVHFHTTTFRYRGQFNYEYQILPGMLEFKPYDGNQLSLDGLDPGNYTFVIRTKTDNGLVSESTEMHLTILTPFWQTWWFYLLVGLGTAALLYFSARKLMARTRRKEQERTRQRELINALRLQSIQAQFNPHFTSNAMNSIQGHISPETIDEAKEYLGMFSAIMRGILISSEKELTPVSEEIKMLETYLKLEQLRFGKRLNYTMEIDDSVDPEFDRIPPMILQPIVENAINHGIFNRPDGGNISIEMRSENDLLICAIEDDGIGRASAEHVKKVKKIKGSGKGTGLVRERLNMVNQNTPDDFEIHDLVSPSGEPIGTKVVIKIELCD